MTVKQGWTGRVYEDFEVGDVYRHPLGRTILSADNTWFSLLTQNTNPIHVDHAYAARTEFARPLVNSTFTLALVTGQSVADVSQNVLANLGWDEVRLPHPVFEGDTIYSESEVLEKRESKSQRTPASSGSKAPASTRTERWSSSSSAPSWCTSAGTCQRPRASARRLLENLKSEI